MKKRQVWKSRLKFGWMLAAAVAMTVPAMAETELRDEVRAYRQAHEKEIVDELAALLAIPNVVARRADIERNAEHLVTMLERRGLEAEILRAGDAPPAVYGELMVPGATRTVVFYSHFDGQPAVAADWSSPPWEPVVRTWPVAGGRVIDVESLDGAMDPEWRLYARSASDDKGPIVMMLRALDALAAAGGGPSVNLKFFFEGEEEAGSPHLRDILAAHHDKLAADAWILADGPVHPSRRLQIIFGARGAFDLELTVYGPVRAVHSGHYGNWVPNPATLLADLLTSMRGPDGEIRIENFSSDVRPLTAAELAAARAMPEVERELRHELGLAWNEGDGERLQALVMQPAINIRGLRSAAVGDRARNAIPTTAQASFDFRLVPDQTPASVRAKVEEHLRREGWYLVDAEPDLETRRAHPRIVRLDWGSGYAGHRTDIEHPASRAVVGAIERGLDTSVIQVPSLGGSVPMSLFAEALNVPILVVPTVNHDNNQHAADENLRLQNLWDGIEVFGVLFAGLDDAWP